MKMPAVVFFMFLACCAAIVCAQPAEEKPHWHVDWGTAQRIALRENKPIFAVMVCRH